MTFEYYLKVAMDNETNPNYPAIPREEPTYPRRPKEMPAREDKEIPLRKGDIPERKDPYRRPKEIPNRNPNRRK